MTMLAFVPATRRFTVAIALYRLVFLYHAVHGDWDQLLPLFLAKGAHIIVANRICDGTNTGGLD